MIIIDLPSWVCDDAAEVTHISKSLHRIMVSLFNRLFSCLATLNSPLCKNTKKKENVINKPEYGRREEHEQVAVYFDVMGFPSRRGRDVIGQGLAVLTNQRLVRAAFPPSYPASRAAVWTVSSRVLWETHKTANPHQRTVVQMWDIHGHICKSLVRMNRTEHEPLYVPVCVDIFGLTLSAPVVVSQLAVSGRTVPPM